MRKIIRACALVLLLSAIPLRAGALNIGLLVYNNADPFMRDVCERIQQQAGEDVTIQFRDSQLSQTIQNEQVETLLKEGVDALVVNAVDRTSAVYLIRMIAQYGTPVVFVNRQPLHEDLIMYDKAYYVGNDPRMSGIMSGELIAEYFTANPAADKNGDGIIQYIMLKGEPGHQDAELRTQYAISTLMDAGFVLDCIFADAALWDRDIAKAKVSTFLASNSDTVECIISNNDEMALGAIEALKAAGYFSRDRYIPVVGVDAIEPALEAIEAHTLYGTVLNDPEGLSEASLLLAMLLAGGEQPGADNFPYAIDNARYIWTQSKKITRFALTQSGF